MTLQLAEAAREAGYDIIIGAPEHNPYIENAQKRGFETHVYQAPDNLLAIGGDIMRRSKLRKAFDVLFGLLPYNLKVRKTLKAQKIDLVYVAQERGLIQIGPGAWLAGLPIFWHVQGGLPDHARMIHRMAAQLASRILCVSHAVQDDLAGFASPALMKKSSVLYNGLPDLEATQPAVKNEKTEILYAGNIVPERGAHILIEAIAALPETAQEKIIVNIAGWLLDADYKAYILDLIPRHHLENRVIVHGYVPDITKLMAQADIIVCPTIDRGELELGGQIRTLRCKEGFGLTALEAMRAGKPVICSAVYGLTEVVQNGATGLHVPANDTKALSRALEILLNNERVRGEMGAAGRQRYEEMFTAEKMEVRFLEVLEELISAAT